MAEVALILPEARLDSAWRVACSALAGVRVRVPRARDAWRTNWSVAVQLKQAHELIEARSRIAAVRHPI